MKNWIILTQPKSSPDLAYDLLMENYNEIFKKSFLLITNKAREVNNPWFD